MTFPGINLNTKSDPRLDSDTHAILNKISITSKKFGARVNLDQLSAIGYSGRLSNEKILESLAPVIEQGYIQLNDDCKTYSLTQKGFGALPSVFVGDRSKASKEYNLTRITKSIKLTKIVLGTAEPRK